MGVFSRDLEVPQELSGDTSEAEFPNFDRTTPIQSKRSGGGGFLFVFLAVIAVALVGVVGLQIQHGETLPEIVFNAESTIVAKSGSEFRYGFLIKSLEDKPLRGDLKLELLRADGQRDAVAYFDLSSDPLPPRTKRKFVVDSKTNRAGRGGFSGVSDFRVSISAQRFQTTIMSGAVVQRVIDADRVNEFLDLFPKK